MTAKHAEPDTFDASNGETQAYIADAARALQAMWDMIRETCDDTLGEGGPVDAAAGLIALLSGDLDDMAEEYTLNLFRHAASKIVDANRDLAHWF